jgi:hypothetical protein
MNTRIPSQQEYEMNERRRAMQEGNEIDRAPLAERKENAQRFYEAMRDDPAAVAERLGWLIDGNYGFGQMSMAKQIIASPRTNRVAALNGLVGTYEYRCPLRMVATAWKRLTTREKAMLDEALQVVIRAAENERE